MKQIRYLAVALLCCLLLSIPALALTAATDVSGNAAVAADGSCRIEMTIILQVEGAQTHLTFPWPADAKDVTLGGQPVEVFVGDEKLQVRLPSMPAGRHTLLLHYELPSVLQFTKTGTLLSVPLLSGFSLPIEKMTFTVTLPGDVTHRPAFISGYHQEQIRLATVIDGNTIQGTTTSMLKDHETLRMDMEVDEALFQVQKQPLLTGWGWATVVLLVLAMAYFCLTMLPKFYRHSRSFTAPEGITAGEVGCCLTGSGTDLSMMVLSWAQLGYLELELDKRGRLLLHKRMEMGNERSYHEGRIFQILFGKRDMVDATSAHFTRIYRKVAVRCPLRRQLYQPYSGDLRIFQGLCVLAGLCGGVQMGGENILWMMLFGLLALIFSCGIQAGCKCIPLRNKMPMLVSVLCGGLWVLLGWLIDCTALAVVMVAFQFLAGIFAAYGGKRSQLGQRVLKQLLGLRQHMLAASAFDLQVLQQKNPNYFYEMVPYALAMGIDRQFARRFDPKTALPECGWLRGAGKMSPQQCAAKLRQIADLLDKARYRKL